MDYGFYSAMQEFVSGQFRGHARAVLILWMDKMLPVKATAATAATDDSSKQQQQQLTTAANSSNSN